MDRLSLLHDLFQADPADAETAYLIGLEYRSRSDWAQAADWFAKAVAASADYTPAYYQWAVTLRDLGDLPGAVARVAEGLAACARTGDRKMQGELDALGDDLKDEQGA